MSLCGTVQQTKAIRFRAVDNRQRNDAVVNARVHLAKNSRCLRVNKVGDCTCKFEWSEDMGKPLVTQCLLHLLSAEATQLEPKNCPLNIGGRCVESTIVAVVTSVLAVLSQLLQAFVSCRAGTTSQTKCGLLALMRHILTIL